MPEKLRLKLHGAYTWSGQKILNWEALNHGYANYGSLVNHPITPGSIISVSAAYFWRGQVSWLVDTTAVSDQFVPLAEVAQDARTGYKQQGVKGLHLP